MRKKILITGGTGTVGKALVPELISHGFNVITLGRKQSVGIASHWQVDLTMPSELESVAEDVDQIVHLAANVDACDGSACLIDNVFTSLNIMRWAERRRVSKIIFASTSGVYDADNGLVVSETSLVRPATLYAWTKYLAECILLHGPVYSVTLRFPHIYGPTDAGQRTMAKILGKIRKREAIRVREEKRDYLHVNDAVSAIMAALEYRGEVRIFNCGSGRLVSMKRIVDIAASHYGTKIPFNIIGKRKNVLLDSTLAFKELGWKATIEFDRGVKELIELADA